MCLGCHSIWVPISFVLLHEDLDTLNEGMSHWCLHLKTCMCVQVRNNLFEPVLAAFLANGERYNLLNSAVLEMVEFIRKENIKPLVIHLVEQYGQRLASCTYVDTFRNLKLKFEQNQVISLASVYRSTHDKPRTKKLFGRRRGH